MDRRPPEFRITSERPAAGVSLLAVHGQIDLATCEELRRAGTACIAEPRDVATVVLDLAGCTFMDSSGISALLGIRRAAADLGVSLVVAGAGGRVARTLDITGASAFLDLADDVGEALGRPSRA